MELPGIYLSKLSVTGLSLREANFKKAILVYANFKNVDCSDADFSEALLNGANFKGMKKS